MARQKESVTVDEYTYEIHQLGALAGKDLFAELALVAGKSANEKAVVGDMLRIPGLIETMARSTFVTSGPSIKAGARPQLWSIFDDHFAGRYDCLAEWLNHCIRVNFPSRKAAPSASDGQ